MRKINRITLVDAVEKMIIDANINLDLKMVLRLQLAKRNETSDIAKNILSQIIENQDIARNESIPMCQDTGVAVFMIDIGNEVYLNFELEPAINEAVRNAYQKGYLRKSVVNHPLERKNTMDNTPAIIHIKQVVGDSIKIKMAAKGAGSENMSVMKMMTPSDGRQGIVDFVLKTVLEAGGKAIFRDLDDEAINPIDRALEVELLEKVNELNVGPMGLSGKTTCIAVKVNSYPCHIASLPVAINIQCHAARHKEIELRGEAQ